MPKIVAAGPWVVPGWDELLDEAMAAYPEGSVLHYATLDPAGEHAAERWCTAGWPFQRWDMGIPIFTAIEMAEGADLAVVSFPGRSSFARALASQAEDSGAPVLALLGGLTGDSAGVQRPRSLRKADRPAGHA